MQGSATVKLDNIARPGGGQRDEVREERARQIAVARTNRKTINQQRFKQAA